MGGVAAKSSLSWTELRFKVVLRQPVGEGERRRRVREPPALGQARIDKLDLLGLTGLVDRQQ